MSLLLTAPAVIKILAALALVLVSNRIFGRLWLSIMIGAITLAAWGGHSAPGALRIAWERAVSANNIGLMVIIFLIVWLSSQMRETGIMRDLVSVVRAHISQRTSMAVLPALIGLLPMPGGALFSAPLVGDCDRTDSVDGLLKTQVNYWFRHVWEYWWPLYPGVLLALEITRLEIWQLILMHLPLSLASIAGGWWFLLRRVRPTAEEAPDAPPNAVRHFVGLISPILIIIAAYAVIRTCLPQLSAWNKYVPMAIGISLAILILQLRRPLPWETWKGILLSKRVLAMALLVALVRIYGAFIEAPLPDGITYAAQMRAELGQWGIPVVLLIMIIPFVSGLASGLAIGFVGASFPIIVSLLGQDPSLSLRLATSLLAYACGYMGMMLSPVHICLIVTNEHFRTSLNRSLAGLVPPAAVVLCFAVALHILVRVLGA